MLKVFGGVGAWGVADVSPPCLKLRTYLRMAKIPCEARSGDPRRGPTKKIPYIVEDDGTCLGDSGFIIEHLERKHGAPVDGRLSASERATGHVVRRTVEESLYWGMIYPRWCTDEGAAAMQKIFAPLLPPVVGGLIWGTIRSGTRKSAFAQGIARHSPDNALAIGKADLDALSALLGDRLFLFGDSPTTFDASLFGTLANVLAFPVPNALGAHAKGLANLVAFRDRVQGAFWSSPEASS